RPLSQFDAHIRFVAVQILRASEKHLGIVGRAAGHPHCDRYPPHRPATLVHCPISMNATQSYSDNRNRASDPVTDGSHFRTCGSGFSLTEYTPFNLSPIDASAASTFTVSSTNNRLSSI